MDQLFQPHQPTTRRDLHELFPVNHNNLSSNPTNDFVPFYQERDKLGKLLSREQTRKKIQSLRESQLRQSRRSSLQHEPSQKNKNSDKTVEKMFKVNTIRKATSSRSMVKLKIALPQTISTTPQSGYYEAAQIVDKMKVNKGRLIGLKSIKVDNKQQKKVSALLNSKLGLQSEKKSTKLDRVPIHQKLELNANLPELEYFHRMQRLQFQVKSNFEHDHLRFKDIMRSSLLLANQIKRDLELD